MCGCVCSSVCLCVCACVFVCVCLCLCVCVVCVFVCFWVYVCVWLCVSVCLYARVFVGAVCSRLRGRVGAPDCACPCTCAFTRACLYASSRTAAVGRECVPLTLPSTACAQSMAADPVAFTMTSDQGAAVEGRVLVRGVGYTSRGGRPWALVGAPIESMLTTAGDAWAEFVFVEGNGVVVVFVAPEGMDRAASVRSTAGSGTVACWMYDGELWVKGAQVRDSTPDWGARMASGESVRVRYVAATRMISVVRRGRSYDLAALPATTDIAHMRFGVAPFYGNSMRVTGESAGARASASGVACAVRSC